MRYTHDILLLLTGLVFGVTLLLFGHQMNVATLDFTPNMKYADERRILYCDDYNTVWLKPTGTSMQPYSFGEPRTYINLTNTDIELQKGDIIVYKHPNADNLVSHAIVDVREDGVKTYGYGNDNYDLYVVPHENIQYIACLYGVPQHLR